MRTPHHATPDDSPPAHVDPSQNDSAELPEGEDLTQHLSAEDDVADSLEGLSAHSFDDMPQDGPLNFDDGTDMGHPRGNTQRSSGTWQAQGGDSGELKPPAEILSNRNGPSDRRGNK